ncbi:MAG: helix-turn-helix domain-containing protein [Nitrososphaerota archaeon]
MALKKVTVAVRVPPTAWVRDLVGSGIESVSILDCLQNGDGSITHLFMIRTADHNRSLRVIEALKRSNLVEGLSLVRTDRPNGFVCGLVRSRRCDVCGVIASRCLMRRGEYRVRDGRLTWTFVAEEDEVPRVLEALREKGIDAELLESVDVEGPGLVSIPQLNLIVRAMELGYFDVPRRASIHEVARELGSSPASLSVSIRRGLKRVLKDYIAMQGYLA